MDPHFLLSWGYLFYSSTRSQFGFLCCKNFILQQEVWFVGSPCWPWYVHLHELWYIIGREFIRSVCQYKKIDRESYDVLCTSTVFLVSIIIVRNTLSSL